MKNKDRLKKILRDQVCKTCSNFSNNIYFLNKDSICLSENTDFNNIDSPSTFSCEEWKRKDD